ncbi:MAG: hypothetical protein K2X47_12195 [Bdellovibrionales bacterium]|nr:hypothetical protein [Bdellovibrionales bacterium]
MNALFKTILSLSVFFCGLNSFGGVFDALSGSQDIPVVIKTSPDPHRPIPPSLKDGITIRIADVFNKGIKNGKASLNKKSNKLRLTWSYSSPCNWHVFAKTYGILAVFRDKNGLEVGSYFSKKQFAPSQHISQEMKKNESFAKFTFQNAIPLKESENFYEFTLKQAEADTLETVELGFNTEEILPKGALSGTTRDYCK